MAAPTSGSVQAFFVNDAKKEQKSFVVCAKEVTFAPRKVMHTFL
jgi:hypothetical protein